MDVIPSSRERLLVKRDIKSNRPDGFGVQPGVQVQNDASGF